MNKQQRIWMQNTALAAFGGLILSVLVSYAYITGRLLLNGEQLTLLLLCFWIGNAAFISLIATGASLRFRDGSLTLPQMVWAISTTLFFMAFSLSSHEPYYLLLLIVMMFGVFRLKPNQFIGFAILTSLLLGLQKTTLVVMGHENSDTVDLVFNWAAFSISLIILISLCRSVAILRARLRERNKRLQEALETKSLFLANMSHELRTPINGVVGMLKLLENTGLNGEQQRYLQLVHSSSESLLGIVNDVLDFSKIDAGKLEIESVEFDLMSLISDFAETLGHTAKEKEVEVIVDLAGLVHQQVKSDPVRVRQIINNLTSNAIKFTEQGEIVIHASTQLTADGAVRLQCSIRDTGVGIEQEKIALIFESFSQADASTTREFGGTGLGLAIVKKLCTLMGGDVEVHSVAGEGSEFCFNILVEGLDYPSDLDTSLFVASSILVVDANISSGQSIARQLVQWGASVDLVHDAASALEWFHDKDEDGEFPESFYLVVSSVLSDMEGVELCRILHTRPELRKAQFVLMAPIGEIIRDDDLRSADVGSVLSRPVIPRNLVNVFSADKAVFVPSQDGALSTVNDGPLLMSEARVAGRKVLLVEDNEINQEVAAGVLEMLDLQCDVAGNGQMAIDMLKAGTKDEYLMVFMDCQMPVMDGYETTRRIRRGEAGDRHRDIVVIAMTANAMKGDREKCLDAGMTDYLTKPIDVDALESAIKLWLNELPETSAVELKEPKLPHVMEVNGDLVWDKPAALSRSFGDHHRLESLARLYLNSSPRLYRQIERNQTEQNISSLKSLAHELKGVAGNLGANRLMLTMASLELACREAEMDKIQVLCSEVIEQHQMLMDELNAYLA